MKKLAPVWRALRPQQWVKNALVFAPILAAHETGLQVYALAAAIFIALSACASAAYILNDSLDRAHDRAHPRKRRRPIAAGELAVTPMRWFAAALMAAGLSLAFAVSAAAAWWVLAYAVLTTAYSLLLKKFLFADVVTLSLLYTLRVLAGVAAAAIPLSGLFLAFAVFLFLALALVKRQAELRELPAAKNESTPGRGYHRDDIGVITALGAASGFTAVLVLMLYITSDTGAEYAHPRLLYLLCPLLIYMLGRIILLAQRGVTGDDPVAFVLRDRVSWACIAAALTVMAAAL